MHIRYFFLSLAIQYSPIGGAVADTIPLEFILPDADVAPEGNPDGFNDLDDVDLILDYALESDTSISSESFKHADVAPFNKVTWEGGMLMNPSPDGVIDAGDAFAAFLSVNEYVNLKRTIKSTYITSDQPKLDGQVSQSEWGAPQPQPYTDQASPMQLRHTADTLYILIDGIWVTEEEGFFSCSYTWQNGMWNGDCGGHVLSAPVFDEDANQQPTPGIDLEFSYDWDHSPTNNAPPPGTPEGYTIELEEIVTKLIIETYDYGEGGSMVPDVRPTLAKYASGFGPTMHSSENHGYVEVSIPLNEICKHRVNSNTSIIYMSHLGFGYETPVILENVSPSSSCDPKGFIEIYESNTDCGAIDIGDVSGKFIYVRNNHPNWRIQAQLEVDDGDGPASPTTVYKDLSAGDDVALGCSVSNGSDGTTQYWQWELIDAVWH